MTRKEPSYVQKELARAERAKAVPPPYPHAMNRLLSLSDWHMRLSQSDADALREYVRWLYDYSTAPDPLANILAENESLKASNTELLAALKRILSISNEPFVRIDVARDAMQDEANAAIAKATS